MRGLSLLVLTFTLTSFSLTTAGVRGQKNSEQSWTSQFPLEKDELSTIGRNPYFILEPGYVLVLEKGTERLTISVLNTTQRVGDVETRVVEERETNSDKLVEISRNYFAISKRTNSVYYFGEQVDLYRNEKIAGHGGSWQSGIDNARFGLMMPGLVLLGSKYYQEHAPGTAMDRAEILSISETVVTPAARFTNCLKVQETTPLEPASENTSITPPVLGWCRMAISNWLSTVAQSETITNSRIN